MLDRVAAAFDSEDYRTAAQLLKQLLKESPQNPWVQFYLGRLQEVSGKLEAAQKIYRQLLRDATNVKIVAQARQGLQRLEAIEQEQRNHLLAAATADPSSTQPGVLILEPITVDRTASVQKFAQIMQLDPYTARLQLPGRGWRLYRSGPIGELRFLGQNLRESGIPCFWVTLAQLQKLQVFQVSYFQAVDGPQAVAVCHNEQGQLGSLTFNWSEITQRVTGLLPIFEQVVDLDRRGRLQRKTQTQDYAQFCDLHLSSRLCILRLYDSGYQFQQGAAIAPQQDQNLSHTTLRINWNSLLTFLAQQLPQVTVWSDFTPFGETVLDQPELLGHIRSHVHLFRRAATNWDPAFHLYSSLVFLKNSAVK